MSMQRKYLEEQPLQIKTPYLIIDLNKINEAYARLNKHLTGVEIYYAMKCNPNPEIMKTVMECGGQFEIASAYEMEEAIKIGADPQKLLFRNPIKTRVK